MAGDFVVKLHGAVLGRYETLKQAQKAIENAKKREKRDDEKYEARMRRELGIKNSGRRNAGGASTSGGNVSISVKHNPARVARGKAVTLRNMASVTIRRLPGGAVAVTGRKLGGARRANPRRQRKSAKR